MDSSELRSANDPVKHLGGVEQSLGILTGLTVEQEIQTLKLLEARIKAETADFEKRLVMQQFRPCKVYPVIIYHDGMRWVCSYGVMGQAYSEYLPGNALGQSGVEAYGEYPEQAMQNFDAMWIGSSVEDNDEDDE